VNTRVNGVEICLTQTFEKRLETQYSDLSGALRQAADYLVANPVEIATRPLRTVSRDSEVSPAAYSRLSRALGYHSFDELREEMRAKIGRSVNDFSARAERLQQDHSASRAGFFDAHLNACQTNLIRLADQIDRDQLDEAVDRLARSRKVVLLGALGSTATVEYLAYMASFCSDNWTIAGQSGASVGAGLTGLGPADALIVVTKPPFAERSIKAARMAHDLGVYVVVITDTHGCPALPHSSARFVVPTESPHFYSSYVVTIFLVETMIGMLASRSGEKARRRIEDVEKSNRALAEVWTN
jgi:DNA-binding MurR/RpiR family transcriptional regulator